MSRATILKKPTTTSWFFCWKNRRKLFCQGLLTILIAVISSSTAAEEEVGFFNRLTSTFTSSLRFLDEENDEKLFRDMVSSVRKWQERRLRRHGRQKRDEEVVCYPDVGCFRDDGPFDYLDMLPSSPEEIDTKIFLYTRKNRELAQTLEYNDNGTSVQESNFNASLPLKFIIHGFGSGCNRVWPREMRLSFLAVEDCNVICVDWANGAADPNYVRAAVNTRLVGKQVALFIKTINEHIVGREESSVGINSRTHIVGFSLGAHVAGFAGSELRNLSRITGLDPAGPLFEGYDPKVRLDKSDALYVDVIHSNGESIIVGGFGVWEPIGHVDFYPNGGRAQRGCQHLIIGGLYDFIYSYSSSNETYRYLCNHRRAYQLFTNSISPKCRFRAFPCESYEKYETGACFTCGEDNKCGQLGYYSDEAPGRGSLYLLTREEEPFCGNQFKINVMFTSSRGPIQTYGRLQILLVDKDGLNETHSITEDVDDLLTSGSQVEKLLVVHPAIEPVEAQILYVAYEGWIYSGRQQWSLDKLTLTDTEGEKKSFCQEFGKLLPSGIPVKLPLTKGDCVANSPLDRYPLAPSFIKKRPYPQQHKGPPYRGPPYYQPENKLRPGGGQDVFYVTNSLEPANSFNLAPSLTGEETTIITINDEVAPKSVPENPTAYYAPNFRYRVKASNPPYWSNVYPPNGARPNRIDGGAQQFPARRRPSTGSIKQKKPSIADHLYPPPPPPPPPLPGPPQQPLLRSTVHSKPRPLVSQQQQQQKVILQQQQRPAEQVLNPGEVVVTENFLEKMDKNADEMRLVESKNSSSSSSSSLSEEVDVSEDQLTIVTFGSENSTINTSNNETSKVNLTEISTESNKNNATQSDLGEKPDYIVLHKLPNGDALNLENLQTYNMADIEKGKMPQAQENVANYGLGMYDKPTSDDDVPRAFHSFDDEQREEEEKLLISESPPLEKVIYEPKPLHELEDLEAMEDQKPPPVYIIEPDEKESKSLKGAVNATILPPVIKSTDAGEWIPIETSTNQAPLRTFGPPNKPESLSDIAHVVVASSAKRVINNKKAMTTTTSTPPINVQLLPRKLTQVLTNVEKDSRSIPSSYAGQHRENKIAPIFKQDERLDRKFGRSHEREVQQQSSAAPRNHFHHHHFPHHPRFRVPRRIQTQLVPESKSFRYIPLHRRPPTVRRRYQQQRRLWWQPQPQQPYLPPQAAVSDYLEAPTKLIITPKIISHSIVKISSPIKWNETEAVKPDEGGKREEEEEEDENDDDEEEETSTTRIIRIQQPFLTKAILDENEKGEVKEEETIKSVPE